MSLVVLTDSTSPITSPALNLKPGFFISTYVTSVRASTANWVSPRVRVSPSSLCHSWEAEYRRPSAGVGMGFHPERPDIRLGRHGSPTSPDLVVHPSIDASYGGR